MKEISQNDSKKKDDIHRKYSVHLAIPRTLRNEINIIDCINSCRGQKDLIHSQILQNSSISYDKSFISLHRLCKNKEEFKNYMLYSYSESQYTKIIDNLLDIEEKIKDNIMSIEKLNNFLMKLKEKKKQKQSDIVNLLSNKESLEEFYKTKICHIKNKFKSNIKNNNKNLDSSEQKKENDKDNVLNLTNASINLNEDNIIDINLDEIKSSDRKKYEEQVVFFAEEILEKKDVEINNKLKEKVQLAYQIFSSEEKSTSLIEPKDIISNFFIRISLFISNQSLGNYSEQIINGFLRELMKINSIGVEILKILKFLNKKYKEMKIEIREKISELINKNENLKNKKITYEIKKEELQKFLIDYKERDAKSTDKIRLLSENENSQYVSFLSDNINTNTNYSKKKNLDPNISDKINKKQEGKIEKTRSTKMKIPYLNISHKNQVINIRKESSNSNKIMKRENSTYNDNNKENRNDNNIEKSNEKKCLINRMKNYQERIKTEKIVDSEHNNSVELSQRSDKHKRDKSNNYLIKRIKQISQNNLKDPKNQHNKTEINGKNKNKLELQIIKTKNINVNRILNINNYQINNNWNSNYNMIENKNSYSNIINTDGNINTSHKKITNKLNGGNINYISNKIDKNNTIQHKTISENNNHKKNVNNLLINNNINIDNNKSKIINNNNYKSIIELKNKRKNILQNSNNKNSNIPEDKKATYKKINTPKNRISLNNVINNHNNNNNNENIVKNTYTSRRKGINSITEIKDIKKNDDTKKQKIISKKKLINENERKEKTANNSNNSNNNIKRQNRENIIFLRDSKSNSSNNIIKRISLKISNSPLNINQKQNKRNFLSPKNNIKSEILLKKGNIGQNSYSFLARNAKSPKESNRIINKVINNNNNVIYVSKKSPKKSEGSFSIKTNNINNNKKVIYNNHTHNSNIIDIINKKNNIPIMMNNYNIYSKRFDNRLKVLTQDITESFCYYKINNTDTDINNFNPIKNISLNPTKFGYSEGHISIDIDMHNLKIIPKKASKNTTLIEIKDIVDVIISNEMININKIHEAYIKYKRDRRDQQNVIMDNLINTREISNIPMIKSDKIKAALCSFFVFSVIFEKKSIPKIDFIFNNYEKYNLWHNCLQYIIKNNTQSKRVINSETYHGH